MTHIKVLDASEKKFVVEIDGIVQEISSLQLRLALRFAGHVEMLIGGKADVSYHHMVSYKFTFVTGELAGVWCTTYDRDWDSHKTSEEGRKIRSHMTTDRVSLTSTIDIPLSVFELAGGSFGDHVSMECTQGSFSGLYLSFPLPQFVKLLKANNLDEFELSDRKFAQVKNVA